MMCAVSCGDVPHHTNTARIISLTIFTPSPSECSNWKSNTVIAAVAAVGVCIPIFLYSAANEVCECLP